MSPSEEHRLQTLKSKVGHGSATDQEKIDFAVLSGRKGDKSSRDALRELSNDQSEDVRYYALRALVLDSIDRSESTEDRCWKLFENDPAARVRSLAAACIGSLRSGSKDADAFDRLKARIASADDPQESESVLEALFAIAGRPPIEWPTQRRILSRDFSAKPKSKEALLAEAADLQAKYMNLT